VRRRALEPALLRAALAPHQHDVETFAPGAHHVGNEFGRVLQIGVDDHHGIAVGVVEAGAHRDFLAEVARQVDEGDARVSFPQRHEQRPCAVAAAVVDIDDFGAGAERIEHRSEPTVELRQYGLLVVDRDDDR
jgi:hypothetical protein